MNIFIENLVKEYGGKQVLNIEGLHIKRGSLCGIIGMNGAGKTTLIRIIAGLEKQDSGFVYYGHKPKCEPPFEIMTLVFQKPYLLKTTVEKNISYPLRLRKWEESEINARVRELISEMGLENQQKQKAWQLSGGETQKVALARALSFRPKLLLLDEPTANIDPASMAVIEKMLKKIREENNTTVVIITHNLLQAKRLCSDMIFMHKGRVVESGSAEQLLNSPRDVLTKRFFEGELLL